MNNEDVVTVVPAVVIKEEPVEFVPETVRSENKGIKVNQNIYNVMSYNGFLIMSKRTKPSSSREEPIEFDPQPSTPTDIVIKDEFIVCSQDYTGSSTDVPTCTQPTSHVTLSVACLGSSQKPDNGQ
ncbi:hypothetical protein CEXT_469681 [Caerostris extrusa]|uniref:Uncharacterized protein n=1 Tax=Caerostris extrusa TaxID=172846 RepID=A0AAV4Y452_CAEEX|nr:hypothetical protein CEXT_469681 [Caerostris extrusa]